MVIDNQDTDLSCLKSDDSHLFDVWGGALPLVRNLAGRLEGQGFRLAHDAPIKLLIDLPQGIAFRVLKRLETLGSVERAKQRWIVVTFNTCSEYWKDLWDAGPDILLVDPKNNGDFRAAIVRAAGGQKYQIVPERTTLLNSTERRILSFLARGYNNKDIAQYLNLQEKTIMNSLTRIYHKLGLSNRTEAALYYWGIAARGPIVEGALRDGPGA